MFRRSALIRVWESVGVGARMISSTLVPFEEMNNFILQLRTEHQIPEVIATMRGYEGRWVDALNCGPQEHCYIITRFPTIGRE